MDASRVAVPLGTYVATAQVCAHRDGGISATFRKLPNVASARVVVN